MLTAAALLADLRRRRIHLEPSRDGIRFRAPAGAITDEDRSNAVAHRDELRRILQNEREGTRLRACYDGLTAEERDRFAAELASGDSRAALCSMLMAMPAAGEA